MIFPRNFDDSLHSYVEEYNPDLVIVFLGEINIATEYRKYHKGYRFEKVYL